jgi:hypothetical protein
MSELAAQAAAIDAQERKDTSLPEKGTGAGSEPAPAGPAPGPDYDGDARELLGMWTDTVVELYPRLHAIYTPPVCDRISQRLARVLAKYGLSLDELLKHWMPEIGLAIALVPVGFRTYGVIREDNALAKARKQGKEPPAPEPAPAAPAPKPPQPAPAAMEMGAAAAADQAVTVPAAVGDLLKRSVDPAKLHTLIRD